MYLGCLKHNQIVISLSLHCRRYFSKNLRLMGQRNWDCSKETKTSRSHHLLHLFPIPNALFSTYSLYFSLPTHHRQSQNKKLKPATPKNGQQTLPTIKEHRPESSLHDHRQTIPPPQIHTDSQFSPPWDFGI